MRPSIPPSTAPKNAWRRTALRPRHERVRRERVERRERRAEEDREARSAPRRAPARTTAASVAVTTEQDENRVSEEAHWPSSAYRFCCSRYGLEEVVESRGQPERASEEQEQRAGLEPAVQPVAPAQSREHGDRQGRPEPQERRRVAQSARPAPSAPARARRRHRRRRSRRQRSGKYHERTAPGNKA